MPQSGALPHFVFFQFIFVFLFRFFFSRCKNKVFRATGKSAIKWPFYVVILEFYLAKKINFLFNLKLISSLNFKSSINSNHPEIQSLLKSLHFPHE